MRYRPDIIFVEEAVRREPMTRKILGQLVDVKVEVIENHQTLGWKYLHPNARFKKEKKALALARKHGEMVKEVERDLFRTTPNEFYIVHSQGCPFDCQYCFLYDYLGHQVPTIFVNVEDMLQSVRDVIASRPRQRLLFHTGEFSDALAFDHITNLSQPLVELFAKCENAFVEFRTKCDNVENLLGLQHNGQTIISWTFSPQRVVQLFEYGTASAEQRIAAARLCQNAGYKIGLRLDPLIRYPSWENDYRKLIETLAAHLHPDLISDCQLGVFRYTPGLGRIIRERFPKSYLRLEESAPCADGKYRYLKHLRLEMYQKIIGWLRRHFSAKRIGIRPDMKIELCMESPQVEQTLASF
jgi:spore photoproduct lyase